MTSDLNVNGNDVIGSDLSPHPEYVAMLFVHVVPF